jgi:antitoxin VapB
MAFSIKQDEADRLARQLAKATGETLTEAVLNALRERWERVRRRQRSTRIAADIRAIQERVARLPVLDPRTPDEIIGYDERGLPR